MDRKAEVATEAFGRIISVLCEEVKKKKILQGLSDEFVLEQIMHCLKNADISKLEDHPKIHKSKDFKILLKQVRERLHEVYGIFQLSKRELTLLETHLEKAKKIDMDAITLHQKILSTHQSTKERLEFYPELYERLFKITGKPTSILDLGAGMNPLSYPFMNLDKVKYIAVELTWEDCSFLNKYFDIMKKVSKLEGIAIPSDLTKQDDFPKTDICFMFKILDTLETLKLNRSKALLQKIKAKNIVVSFPSKTIGGRKPIKERGWFLKLLRELNYTYEKIECENEVFYVIIKN